MDVEIQPRPVDHVHAYAPAAETRGIVHLCDYCGAVADDPQVCTDPDCVHVACRACMQAPF